MQKVVEFTQASCPIVYVALKHMTEVMEHNINSYIQGMLDVEDNVQKLIREKK